MEYDLAHEIQAHQAYLEAHRQDPDDETIWEDYKKAKKQMEVAWLQHTMQKEPQ